MVRIERETVERKIAELVVAWAIAKREIVEVWVSEKIPVDDPLVLVTIGLIFEMVRLRLVPSPGSAPQTVSASYIANPLLDPLQSPGLALPE